MKNTNYFDILIILDVRYRCSTLRKLLYINSSTYIYITLLRLYKMSVDSLYSCSINFYF